MDFNECRFKDKCLLTLTMFLYNARYVLVSLQNLIMYQIVVNSLNGPKRLCHEVNYMIGI